MRTKSKATTNKARESDVTSTRSKNKNKKIQEKTNNKATTVT